MLPNNNLWPTPRLVTPQTVVRPPMVLLQPTPVTSRAPVTTIQNVIPSPVAVSSQVRPTASSAKDHPVLLPKTDQRFGIMEFASGITIDLKHGNTLEMKRDVNPYNYRSGAGPDPNASSSNMITTSTGQLIPKTGAGSEYGREQKEALKRKRFTSKGTNIEDVPWLLTNRLAAEKKLKQYRGMKKGGITDNSSYYVFIQNKECFDAYPIEDWHSFTPTNVYKTLDFDEAEQKYQDRHKILSKWFKTHQPPKENEPEDEQSTEKGKGKGTSSSKSSDFKLLDMDEYNYGHDSDDDDDNDDDDDGNSKKDPKRKRGRKAKGETNLSDDDDEDEIRSKVKKHKTKKEKIGNEQGEDSDDGDHEDDEIDYTSDETSEEEDDVRDANTVKASVKYEVKGIDEELRAMPDINKKLENMDENEDGIDFEEDDDDIPEIDDNDDENTKGNENESLSELTKNLKMDQINKEIGSSSDDDDDDLDDSDPDNDQNEKATSSQPIPSQQIKTEKGHKKAKEEELRALKSQVISRSSAATSSSTSSNPCDLITREKVHDLVRRRKHISFTTLIQKFLPKNEQERTAQVKSGIVNKLAEIIRHPPFEQVTIKGEKQIRLTT